MHSTYINENRLTEEFVRLTAFDSPSYQERKIAEYVKKELISLGLQVSEDDAAGKLQKEDGTRVLAASNLYARLEGTRTEDMPVLFSAHLDTVNPGIGKKAVIHEDGTITSAKDTVLGADDAAGIAAILEALKAIKENDLPHPPVEILFTVAEEPFCEGSRFIEYDRLRAKEGYVLDLAGDPGLAANEAPSILSMIIEITGKASHAGFAPEEGINALSIAAEALCGTQTGRTKEDLTVNFGTIHGGNGINIVPERVRIEGEIRGISHEQVVSAARQIRETFERAAAKEGGRVSVQMIENIRGYSIPKNSRVVRRFTEAVKAVEGLPEPKLITTFGGSDANRLNENGIETIVVANAMKNCHSTEEYITKEGLIKTAQLTLKLMTECFQGQ